MWVDTLSDQDRAIARGAGSAEGWVRKRFVLETSTYRSRQSRARTALIVMIDGDSHTVQERVAQLDQALAESSSEPVSGGEQIARVVPRRNIETWICCLNGMEVDEENDYKRSTDKWNQLIPSAAKTLSQWTRSQAKPPSHCVDSLRIGVRELRRLER
jgi:hypothetical protein